MGLFDKITKKKTPKTLVIGLDGVSYTLLKDLQNLGRVSNITSIFDKGYFGQMDVCIPEISSVSWSSFMTGTQSGEHGIFGFMDLEPKSYNLYFPNLNHLKAPTIWEILAAHGRKSVIINMPSTYPAPEINGALISGFVAIDIHKAVYPSSLVSRLQEMDYKIDLDNSKARSDHDYLFRELYSTLEGRKQAADFLWNEIDWDLFIIVITGTDRLLHFLWDAFEDEKHPYNQDFLDYFDCVDRFLGHLYDRFLKLDGSKDNRNSFYMLSDHGFTKIKSEVYLNRWLQEAGYLKYQVGSPETIMDIGPGSSAFALDPSRIYINLKGKYPFGTVDSEDYSRVCQEIKNGLEGLTFEGREKIADRCFFKEELYHGPYLDQAPDLVLLANHGYDLKARVNSSRVFALTQLSGMHTQNDAFFFSKNGDPCSTIFNAKDIILSSLL